MTPAPRRAAPLGLLWLAASLPLLVYAAVFQSSVAALLGLVGQLLLACLVASLPLGLRVWRWLLAGALLLLLGGGTLERELSKYDWQVSDKAGVWRALTRKDEVAGYGFRNWNAAAADAPVKLSLEVRLVSGQPTWDWFRSDDKFILTPQTGPDYPYTRVQVPAAQPGAGPPYLMRTFDLRKPLGGTIFRVLIDLKRVGGDAVQTGPADANTATDASAGTDSGPDSDPDSNPGLNTDIVRGAPIGGRQCRGILLQAWAFRGGGRCLPLTLTDTWTRYSLSWRVPEVVDASVVRVLLGGLEGDYDVRRVRLFTAKKELGPLLPQGGALNLTWGERPEAQSGRSFIPNSKWQRIGLQTRQQAGDSVTAHLSSASGLVLETRGVTLTDANGTELPEAVSSTRQTIVFGDPNLAGHTLATLGLALVTLSPPFWGVLAAALTLFGLVLTGSRAALIGLVGGLLWLFWLRLPRGARRLGFTAFGLAGLGVLGVLWPKLSALRLFSLGEVTARSDIWQDAWTAFTTRPLHGLGAGGFPRYWAETHSGVGGEAVQHAHNVWLEFASSYGVFGLLSITALTVGLIYLAWRVGGARALAFVVGVLVMNVFDTTLFYAGVLFPLFLTLGVFRTPQWALTSSKASLHNAVRADAHNRRVNTRQVPPK